MGTELRLLAATPMATVLQPCCNLVAAAVLCRRSKEVLITGLWDLGNVADVRD